MAAFASMKELEKGEVIESGKEIVGTASGEDRWPAHLRHSLEHP